MYTNMHSTNYQENEVTLILCEACFDVLLEDDTEYINGKAFCHLCLREECQ